MSMLQADVIVVGAGPAGLAAVSRLSAAGRSVLWVDQQTRPGGQIWRAGLPPPRARALQQALDSGLLRQLSGHAVLAAEGPQQLLLQPVSGPVQGTALRVSGSQLLLATGARERFLPLPGWTLPGVSGAGGLQALVKEGWPIPRRRVVLAGSGPLLLAAADSLRTAGAQVLLIAEQATAGRLAGFAAGLDPARLTQAAGLRWRLRGVPYRPGCWVTAALGTERLEGVRLSDGRREWELGCDALGLGFGLLPNTELAGLLGCRVGTEGVQVDPDMQTSVPGVFAAGECCGIGGVDKALIEGELAALRMLGQDEARLRRRHAAARRFAGRLASSFALRPELLKLAAPDTLVCRCEDVSLGALRQHEGWREAKLQTRCGMGACQGRICGPICESVLAWPSASQRGQRAPLQPAPIGALLGLRNQGSDDSTSTS